MKAVDLKQIIERGDEENVQAYLNFLEDLELVDLFYLIDEELYPTVISKVSNDTFSTIFPFFERSTLDRIVSHISDAQLIKILNGMETDDIAYTFRELGSSLDIDLLDKLEKKDQVEKILSFPVDSAGSIMQSEVCLLKDGMTIGEAIESIRKQKSILGEIFCAFVVDEDRKMLGDIQLDDLILGKFIEPISKIMNPLKYYVDPMEDQEKVAQTFSKYDLSYMPVIDDEGKLLGQITFDDIQDVMESEANEDLLAFAGVNPAESLADTGENKIKVALGRFPWLVFSISASMLTGYILTFFENQVTNAIIFASFVPLIMNTTGNVGTQTAMIITRNFALGANEFGDFRLPLWREFLVGLIVGGMAATLTFLVTLLFYQDLTVSIRVGATIIISVVTAVLFGMFVPIGFKKVGIDPAVAAGPLVTSGCDMISVSLYLGVIVALNKFF